VFYLFEKKIYLCTFVFPFSLEIWHWAKFRGD